MDRAAAAAIIMSVRTSAVGPPSPSVFTPCLLCLGIVHPPCLQPSAMCIIEKEEGKEEINE